METQVSFQNQEALAAKRRSNPLVTFRSCDILAFDICRRWNVPGKMAVGIRYHHDPARSGGSELAHILCVADGIAMMCGLGGGADVVVQDTEEKALRLLSLNNW
jgi:HD-like signal output (HDOD) protein